MIDSDPQQLAMTPRQRFLTALNNQVPDRVPVCPDTSNYIPCKLTGKPYWDIYFHGDPPLWKAYFDVVDRYGFEAWNTSSWGAGFEYESRPFENHSSLSYDRSEDATIRTIRHLLPGGELTSRQLCFRHEPPTPIEKPIKDPVRDLPLWFATCVLPKRVNADSISQMRQACADRQQAFGLSIGYPGFQAWEGSVQGGIETLTYLMMDHPELLDEWHERHMAVCLRQAELLLAEQPDYLFLGGSGTITMASPQLARRYALPTIQKVTAMAAEAGVPTLLHSCGKSWALLEMLAAETRMNCVNPIELPPHGDAELKPAKQAFGDRLALMGNLHTTDVMLRGTVDLVRRRSIEAMADAGPGGGFILSTGDQCPRDTPDENLHAMVETARELGVYDEQGQLPRLAEARAN